MKEKERKKVGIKPYQVVKQYQFQLDILNQNEKHGLYQFP